MADMDKKRDEELENDLAEDATTELPDEQIDTDAVASDAIASDDGAPTLTKEERRAIAKEEYKQRERERIARQNEEAARLEAKQQKAQAEGKPIEKKRKAVPDKPGVGARIKRWFRDLAGELRHVTWPSWRTVVKSTSVVLAVVGMFVLVLSLMDVGLGQIYNVLTDKL